MQELIDFIKSEHARIDFEGRWLVWDSQWTVYTKYPYHRWSTVLYEGDSLAEAVKVLKGDS